VTVAATIALTATSLAVVSVTLSVFACEAKPSAVDNKTNRQVPFIQSGVMTRDKQPACLGPLEKQSTLIAGAIIILILKITLVIIIIKSNNCGVGKSSWMPAGKRTSTDSDWTKLKGCTVYFSGLHSFVSLN